VKRRVLGFGFILLACVGCDHAVKQVAVELLSGAGVVSWLGGAVRFQLVANPGAFLSLGAGLPEPVRELLLIGMVPLVLAAVGWLVLRVPSVSRMQLAALGLIAGGGLANWLDRVIDDGAVTDFVSLGLGSLRTGIFNVADVAIVLGLVLLLGFGSAARRAEPARD
jgi:signal peptidase II